MAGWNDFCSPVVRISVDLYVWRRLYVCTSNLFLFLSASNNVKYLEGCGRWKKCIRAVSRSFSRRVLRSRRLLQRWLCHWRLFSKCVLITKLSIFQQRFDSVAEDEYVPFWSSIVRPRGSGQFAPMAQLSVRGPRAKLGYVSSSLLSSPKGPKSLGSLLMGGKLFVIPFRKQLTY